MVKITKIRREEILNKFPEFKNQLDNLKLTIDVMTMEFSETLNKLEELEEQIEDIEQKKIDLNI
jgi:septation ring formation regulator EzrA